MRISYIYFTTIECISMSLFAAAPVTHHLQRVVENTSAADSVLFASYNTALLFVTQTLVLTH